MKVEYTRGALGVVLCALVALPAFAQHEDHQAPGAAASAPPASMTSCAQGSQGVTRSIDVLSARIEEARQSNDASKMRATVADLEVALAQMKTQLADCTVVTPGGSGGMGNMPGMDHSKMPIAPGVPVMPTGSTVAAPDAKAAAPVPVMDHSKMKMPPKAVTASGSGASAPGPKTAAPMAGMDHSKMAGEKAALAPAVAPSKAAQAASVVFALRTDPAPPRSGKNDFEVTVKDRDGKPIADAEVSLAFYRPPMPSMKMPEMRNTVKLTSAGNGIYKGSGTIGMAGDWDVTVTASRNGQQLDVKKMRLTAK